MKYFIDTEFHEDFHKPLFGRNRHFIDLISIGIICEDGRAYYAISKDFDIKAAWNSYQLEQVSGDMRNIFPEGKKVYWLRENVLRPIFEELKFEEYMALTNEEALEFTNIIREYSNRNLQFNFFKKEFLYRMPVSDWAFNFSNFKKTIKKYGKSNKQIAIDIMLFVWNDAWQEWIDSSDEFFERGKRFGWNKEPIEFYGYYADYDWVVFCALFGKMINLPNDFPMYCQDLKQTLDSAATGIDGFTFEQSLAAIKNDPRYPKQTNEHNALADAKWNKELYKFLTKL